MGGNLVKLIFSCISTGSGWSDLRKNAADSLKNMGQLSGALKSVALHAGTMGGAIGRALSAFAIGNVWGIATVGITALIDKLGIFKSKSDDTKEKLDKLAEASRKFYEAINDNSKTALENIDKETKLRNDQLDITNRMIKAELQLQKTRAISSGDTKGVERIDRQIAEQDQKTALQKAGFAVNSSARRRDEAEAKMAATIAAEEQARRDLEKAEENLKAAGKPVTTLVQSSAGAYYKTTTPDTTRQKDEVEAAKKRLELAKQQTVAAKEAYGVERDKYELAVSNVKALEAEQKAADAEAERAASKSQAERTIAYNKQIRDLEAKINAEIRSRDSLNDDELEQLRAKYEQRREEAELAVKDAEEKKLIAYHYGTDQDKAVADKELKLARERVKTIAAEEKKAEEDLAQKNKEERIKALQKEVEKANETRKKALQEDIEANSKRAADLRQKLADATARAKAAHDVFGNAAGMDQGGGLSDKRRERINEARYESRALSLIKGGKIGRGEDGKWAANGRLSNLNQAILDRMNADLEKSRLKKENNKVVSKLDELKRAIEQMSTL